MLQVHSIHDRTVTNAMMETITTEEDIPAEEIPLIMQQKYDALCDLVEAHLNNGQNPGVRVQAYAKGAMGRTHFSIGIEGLLIMNGDFITALEELAPKALIDNETNFDG